MTQEDKKLLLQDLCSRLPYGVIVQAKALGGITTEGILWFIEYDGTGTFIFLHKGSLLGYNINEDIIKPYLRSMSSMTKEERQEIGILIKENRPNPYGIINNKGIDNLIFSVSVTSRILIDWLNAHYFDYRGLIPKGLAIEVTEENNLYKDNEV